MRHTPPESLVELLGRLALATPDDFRAVAGRARRLARGLPLFESVWIDALAQAGVLTAFQAAEINARRGECLQVGPYVLDRPLGSLQYAETYAAHKIETGERVLLVAHDMAGKTPRESAEIRERLEKLVVDSAPLGSISEYVLPVVAADVDAQKAWAVCRDEKGLTDVAQSAMEWIIHHGRFPPKAVLEIARVMTAALADLQRNVSVDGGLSHGDIRAESLYLTASGRVVLPCPGLRAAFRPTESHATAELPPQAYDGLAPERLIQATPANPSSDIFACGCLWWHLLTARSALPGGNGLAKMRSAQTLDIPPIKPLAPDTPRELAIAIEACVARNPAARPQSLDQLAGILGPSAHGGHRRLARLLGNVDGASKYNSFARGSLPTRQTVAKLIGATAIIAIIAGAVWFLLPDREITQTHLEHPPKNIDKNTSNEDSASTTPSMPSGTVTSPKNAINVQPHQKLTGSQSANKLLDDKPTVDAASLQLRPGQTISSKGPGRVSLLVSRNGLLVDVDKVCFENIDFVYQHTQEDKKTDRPGTQVGACIDLRAPSIIFR
ncbi:MAG: hypothetical protein JXM70_05510, partial [Pirellulales bacterium]|nr:hypothetical protein [Pirellulales bacterium]